MATVYLHIGAPKTATSTLQSVLAGNYDRLLEQGVLYPRQLRHGDAHHTLICDLIEQHQGNRMPDLWFGPRARGQSWQLLQQELAEHGPAVTKVILSSELFFGQSHALEAMLADIRDRLSGHNIKMVIYLRRQDQLYSSFFNQDVKGVRQWAFSAYEFYQTHQIFQRDYAQVLDLWSKLLGRDNILIRPYEPAQWEGGDIVEDFCRLTGIGHLKGGHNSHNESLGPGQLYLKQCLNRIGYDKGDNEAVLGLLMDCCPEEPLRDCIYVHRGLYRRHRRDWLRVNERLAAEYLGGRPLFIEPIPEPAALTVYEPEPALALRFAEAIYERLLAQPGEPHRALFARALLLLLAEQDLWQPFGEQRRAGLLQWL